MIVCLKVNFIFNPQKNPLGNVQHIMYFTLPKRINFYCHGNTRAELRRFNKSKLLDAFSRSADLHNTRFRIEKLRPSIVKPRVLRENRDTVRH